MKIKGISVLRLTKNVMDFLSLIAIAAAFVFFALIFNNYPADKTYYIMLFNRGFTVEKIALFSFFVVCCSVNGFLFILSRFPVIYKYPVKITADNIEIQYHLAKIMLSSMQICISFFCCNMISLFYRAAAKGLYISYLPYIITFGIILILIYFVYFLLSRRYK